MPICPNCNYEYVPGIAICPDCNIPLVDSIELKNYSELSEEDWVLVYTSFSEIEADMLKENLESAGIPSSVLSQKDSNFPVMGDLSKIKLMVKKGDVQAALEFIQTIMPTCPSCNYEYVKGITVCPHCHQILLDSETLSKIAELPIDELVPVFVSKDESEIDSLVRKLENYLTNSEDEEIENCLIFKSPYDLPFYGLMTIKKDLFMFLNLITDIKRGNIDSEEDADE